MRVVEQSFEEIKIENLFKKVEKCGRVCYKSENLITETSGFTFVKNLIKSGHGSVLEHFTFALKVPFDYYQKLENKHYPFFFFTNITYPLVSFNFRTIILNYKRDSHDSLLEPIYAYLKGLYPQLFEEDYSLINIDGIYQLKDDDFLSLTMEERDIHEYITIKLIIDRGVSHELVRHRPCSFSQESTRYCNYGKDKFGKEITVIKPTAINEKEYLIWERAMKDVEKAYFEILEQSNSPQLARSVLPNSLKTELVITTNIKEWKWIFDLRTSPAAHPDVQWIMKKVEAYFKERKYIC